MKKNIFLITAVLLAVLFTACFEQGGKLNASSEVPAIDENAISNVANALCAGGLVSRTWSSPWTEDAAETDYFSFYEFYCYMAPKVPDYPGEIPAETYEALIKGYFDISTDLLRRTVDYNAGNNTYMVNSDVTAGMLRRQVEKFFKIDSITSQDNGTIKVTYRIIWGDMAGSGDGSDSAYEGYISLTQNRDYYLVNSVTVTADYSDKYN